MSRRLFIGTSGYQYDHWRGVLYPEGLPQEEWFRQYAGTFGAVEINNTFYNLPEPGTFDRWRDQAPPGFRFAVKFSRYGTHMKKLEDPEEPLQRFLERARRLKTRLGPVLVQLPPHWGADAGRLDAFLAAAPGDVDWAVEFRDPDWLRRAVYQVLRDHGAALVIHDRLADHPVHVTADLVYLRYHGQEYRTGYSPQYLSGQARRIRRFLDQGLRVHAYFNNDLGGHAVANARDLCRFLDHH